MPQKKAETLSDDEINGILEEIINIENLDLPADDEIVKQLIKTKITERKIIKFLVSYARNLERDIYN